MTEKKESNIGVALNRRLEVIVKNREKIQQHDKRIAALENIVTKQQEYITTVEKRLIALETQPSIEGDKLLNYIAETNKDIKTLYDQYNSVSEEADILFRRTELDGRKVESAE
jgi:predicted  nucleic acid-binding Zn-ribbon protein